MVAYGKINSRLSPHGRHNTWPAHMQLPNHDPTDDSYAAIQRHDAEHAISRYMAILGLIIRIPIVMYLMRENRFHNESFRTTIRKQR